MPNSMVLLDIKSTGVAVELQLPLNQLQLAFGHDVAVNSDHLIARLGPVLSTYILEHIHFVSKEGTLWKTALQSMEVHPVEESASGPYQELTVHLWMESPAGADSRNFTMQYDVIIHQVVTHKALVAVRQDWERGMYGEQLTELGVIRLNVRDNVIPPFVVNQESGSLWKGFKSMVGLGMQHIQEGTDHLLFLLVLLLPAPLLVYRKRWSTYGGAKYSIVRLLKVVTAFTVGHSITLLAGALGWFRLPGQPVEILIAFSILISAIHAIRPVFSGKEMYIAAGFGLIHGLAFAGTLAALQLEPGRMALSILGFNAGIELMQLFIIVLIVPWLILLSRHVIYKWIRTGGAMLAGVAAIAWMVERITNRPNQITTGVQTVAVYAPWIIVLLACTAVIISCGNYFRIRKEQLS